MPDPLPIASRCPVCGSPRPVGDAPPGPTPRCPRCAGAMTEATLAAGPTRLTPRTPAGPDPASLQAERVPAEVLAARADPKRCIGRYVLVKELGHGGMGVVYQGWDLELGRWLALKFILPEAATAEDLARFKREAKLTARLDHPNIAPIYDVGEAAGRHFFVMKYVDGMTLDRAFSGLGRSDGTPEALRDRSRTLVAAVRDACRGVGHAHRYGVVHRDLKPANIMIDRDGRVYVMDFGLARPDRSADAHLTADLAILGTPAFMAPEQARGQVHEVDARSDVYSLGATLYSLLTGRLPHPAKSAPEMMVKVASEPPPLLRVLRPDLPVALEGILVAAMAQEKARRPADASALAAALDGYLQPAVPGGAAPSPSACFAATVSLPQVAEAPGDAHAPTLAARRQVARSPVRAPGSARPQGRPAAASAVARPGIPPRLLVAGAAAALLLGALAWYAHVRREPHEEPGPQAPPTPALNEVEVAREQVERLAGEAHAILAQAQPAFDRYREKLHQAEARCDEALRSEPGAGPLYAVRGRLRLECGDLPGAEEDLSKAIARLGAEGGSAAHHALGRVFLERWLEFAARGDAATGSRRDAEIDALRAHAGHEFEAAAAAGPGAGKGGPAAGEGEGERRFSEGMASWGRGDGPRAETILRTGAEGLGDADCAWALAVVTAGEERDRWLERALQLRPHHADALLARALARAARGETPAAIADFESALRICPRLEPARIGADRARLALRAREGTALSARCAQTEGARAELERALATVAPAFSAGLRPPALPRLEEALAGARAALARGDMAAAAGLLDESDRLLADLRVQVPVRVALGTARAAWSAAATLSPADEELLHRLAAEAWARATGQAAAAEAKAQAGELEEATRLLRAAGTMLTEAAAAARAQDASARAAAQAQADAQAAAAQAAAAAARARDLEAAAVAAIDRVRAAIARQDPFEARTALDALERLVPGDARLAPLKNQVDKIPRPRELVVDLGRQVKMEFVLIRAGTFRMGSSVGKPNEAPEHAVTISRPFYLGKFEVTQEQWQLLLGKNPSKFVGPRNPVERVSWDECQAFVQALQPRIPGRVVSLPTEAQWEYACRAGSTTVYGFGDDPARLPDYAWFAGNAGGTSHPVGGRKPNAWGLYDVHGNVWEWCADRFAPYPDGAQVDPVGPREKGGQRVLRGGGWFYDASVTCVTRSPDTVDSRSEHTGLRVALTSLPGESGR